MSKKKQHHEEHVDEAWLLPYSDMLTLLLALFIVMFAMGQTDKAKLRAMAQQFNIIFAGGSTIMQEEGNSLAPMESSEAKEGVDDGVRLAGESQKEEDTMTQIKKQLEQEISDEGYSDKVKVELNSEGLGIAIQDVVLFNSGDAEIIKDMSPLLSNISKMLSGLDNKIKVAGYTDNVPISNGKYRSNWDLSAMRAINVMNFISATGGIGQDKMSIQAYGEYMPKYSNDTEDGKARNRRVEIFVARKYTSTTEAKKN